MYLAANTKSDRYIFNDYSFFYTKLFKMSMIEDCRLKDIGQLSFDFHGGGCNTFTFGIMLCFAKDADSICHS